MNHYDQMLNTIDIALKQIDSYLNQIEQGTIPNLHEQELISLENKFFIYQGDLLSQYETLVESFQSSEDFISCVHAYLKESKPETDWLIIADFPNICQEVNGELKKPYRYSIVTKPVICSRVGNEQMMKSLFSKNALHSDIEKFNANNDTLYTISSKEKIKFNMEKVYKNLKSKEQLYTFNHHSTNFKDYYDGCNTFIKMDDAGKVNLVIDRKVEANIMDTKTASKIFDDYIANHKDNTDTIAIEIDTDIQKLVQISEECILPLPADETKEQAFEEASM